MKDPGRNDMDRNGDDMKSGDQGGKIDCERVLDLAPTYADGELSGGLADSVRAHLMDCSPCRLAIQDHATLGAWFLPTEEVPVPADFASRVTELAFSGAVAERSHTLKPLPAQHASDSARSRQVSPLSEGHGRLLSFSVALTAAAAAAALLLTLFLASREEPGVGDETIYAVEGLEMNLEALKEQNRALTQAPEDSANQPDDGE